MPRYSANPMMQQLSSSVNLLLMASTALGIAVLCSAVVEVAAAPWKVP